MFEVHDRTLRQTRSRVRTCSPASTAACAAWAHGDPGRRLVGGWLATALGARVAIFAMVALLGLAARWRIIGCVAGAETIPMDFQALLDEHRRRAPAAARRRQAGRQLHPGTGAGAGRAVRHRAAHLRRRGGLRPATRDVPFSIQSISKLFTLTLAMRRWARALWERDRPRAVRQPVQLAGAARARAGHAAQPVHQRRRDRGRRPPAQRLRRRRDELLRLLSRLAAASRSISTRRSRLGGGHGLSQRRAGATS